MRQKIFHISLIVVMLVAGAGAFTVTRTLKSSTDCTRNWLGLSRNQCEKIRSEDPGFSEQAQHLSQNLQDKRQALVALISDSSSSDNAIRTTAREVWDVHHDLMRRVVQHLLVVRRYADPGQCTQLTNLCSGVICSGGGNRRGWGNQEQGMGPGQGMGRGRNGMGMGRGRRNRYGRLAPVLGLTEAQKEAATQKDPSFEQDVIQLSQQIHDTHDSLAQALEDPNTPDNDVQQTLENLIALRVQLEQRTVDYVLSIRSMLDTTQQQRLIGLSGGGRQLRYGRQGFDLPSDE